MITGSYVDPNRSKVTVGVLADEWLASKLDLAPKTRDRYEGIIRAHIQPQWGSVPLAAVRHGEIQRWLAGLEVAPATFKKVHRVLSMILAYAVKDGRLDELARHVAGRPMIWFSVASAARPSVTRCFSVVRSTRLVSCSASRG